MTVPVIWVTLITLVVKAYSASTSLETQLGGANLKHIHIDIVNLDVLSDNLELSRESDVQMHGLTDEQKQVSFVCQSINHN